jgi:hypothetical protein
MFTYLGRTGYASSALRAVTRVVCSAATALHIEDWMHCHDYAIISVVNVILLMHEALGDCGPYSAIKNDTTCLYSMIAWECLAPAPAN